jgi:hypothetical protein
MRLPVLQLEVTVLQGPTCTWTCLGIPQEPVLLLEMSNAYYSGLSCTRTCLLYTDACAKRGRVYTAQMLVLHPDVSTLYVDACASYGRVYTIVACAASGRVYTIDACAASGRVYTIDACAASGRVYTLDACAAGGRANTCRGISCTWTRFFIILNNTHMMQYK